MICDITFDPGYRMQDARIKMQDAGFRDSGFKIQDSKSRMQVNIFNREHR
jgi:hypothetical protein